MESLERYLLVSTFVIFIYVFYRWLKRYLRRNEIQEIFPYLFPFDKQELSGLEVLKLDMPYPAEVKILAIADSGEEYKLYQAQISAGIQEIALDLSSLKSGLYDLKVNFPNQTIRRPFKKA